MSVIPPDGWKNFNGGTTNEALCDTGLPLALGKDHDLSCAGDILIANLTVSGGVPPYTWATTGGLLTVVDATHASLAIHTAIPVSHERCIAQAFGYSGSVQSFNSDLCQENAASFCVSNYYNCYGQWIMWVHLDGLFEDTCWDKVNQIPGPNYPRQGRMYNCNECSNSYLGACARPAGCDLPILNPEGIDITTSCDLTLLDLHLPALAPPFYCWDDGFVLGQTFTNFGETDTFDNIGPNPLNRLTSVARLAAQIHLHPEDALLTFDDVTALNVLLSGCAPCAIMQGATIIVTVTDILGNTIPIEVAIA